MEGIPHAGYFGRASDQQSAAAAMSSEAWGNLDSLDVDLLAEYLLGDENGTASGEMSFDFNLDASQRLSSMISPDNSEDGRHPPLADKRSSAPQGSNALLQTTGSNSLGLMPSIALKEPSPVLSSNIAFLQAPKDGLISYHQGTTSADLLTELANKRRRVDPLAEVDEKRHFCASMESFATGRGKKKSQAQIDRRRERNRILARRTRLRKKFFFESLQKEVLDLQRENEQLKEIVKEEIGSEEGKAILDECDAMERLPQNILEQCAQEMSLDEKDMNLVKSIQQSQYAFVITDPSLQDNPIVFASEAFLSLTGYSRDLVLGRNCRFLQGSDTKADHVNQIRQAMAKGEDVSVTILNYTADGTPFWNNLFVAALRDADNNIVNFIGVIVPVATPSAANQTGEIHQSSTAMDEFNEYGYDVE